MEMKIINDRYVFQNPAKVKLYILRAIQTERNRYYDWTGGNLQYVH
jgi:hypothetical protein